MIYLDAYLLIGLANALYFHYCTDQQEQPDYKRIWFIMDLLLWPLSVVMWLFWLCYLTLIRFSEK